MKVEFDGTENSVVVNDVRISFELLDALTNPDATKLYRFSRIENTVTVLEYADPEVVTGVIGGLIH